MPDYLSCGACQSDFELSDIVQFIEHKRRDCKVNSSSDLAMELLECVKCLRKFHTPWPLLRHVQSEHHISVVRNLVLPTFTSTSTPSRLLPSPPKTTNMRTAHTQTVKTCLKRLVCPYQTNLPAECCLKVEAPSEDGCCCLDTTEKSHNEVSSCQPGRGCGSSTSQVDTNVPDTVSSESEKQTSTKTACGDDPCPCAGVSRSPTSCCDTRTNEASPTSRCGVRSRGMSLCCDPTQSLLSFGERSNPCKLKNGKRRNSFCCQQAASPPRCPCKPSSNTADQTCQTDFAESFDIDMDLLLDSDDLNVAMESSFHDDAAQNPTMLAPSKAIQTVVQASNFGNYSVSTPSLMAHGISTTSEPRNTVSMAESFVTTNACTSSSSIQQEMGQYQDTYDQNENEMNATFMYNQERSHVDHMNTERPQLWNASSVSPESLVVQQESLLNLLGSSTGISSASFEHSINSRTENPSSMQSQQITLADLRRPHAVRIETLENKRKRPTRDYRFNCSECGKAFRQNVHLRKHVMAKHTKQKPHKCTYCRYTTVEKSHLTVHIRTHTGEKPFRCRICNYSTAQNCTLKSHYLRKHPGSCVQCNLCGTDFITNHERDKHEKVCHRDENMMASDLTHIQVPNIFSQGNQSSDGHNLNASSI